MLTQVNIIHSSIIHERQKCPWIFHILLHVKKIKKRENWVTFGWSSRFLRAVWRSSPKTQFDLSWRDFVIFGQVSFVRVLYWRELDVECCYFWPSYIGGGYFSKGRGLHMLSPQLQLQTLQSSSFANSWFPKPRQMSITSTFNNPRELSRVILLFLQTCSFSGFKKKGKFSIIGLNFTAEHIKAKLWDSFKRRKFMDAASNMPPLWMGSAKTWWYLATKTAPQKLYAPRYFQTTREQFWFRKKASLLKYSISFWRSPCYPVVVWSSFC